MRQLEKVPTKALQGCCAQMSHFPMARASMLVVATTSLVLALMNTCREARSLLRSCVNRHIDREAFLSPSRGR